MRRRVASNTIAGAQKHGLQHGAARALAVGAADRNHRKRRRKSERLLDPDHALEPHRDRLRMQLLEIFEPLSQTCGFRGASFELSWRIHKSKDSSGPNSRAR